MYHLHLPIKQFHNSSQQSIYWMIHSRIFLHGIEEDRMERSSHSEEMRRNFLEHTIIKLLRKEWGISFRGSFASICRYGIINLFSVTIYFIWFDLILIKRYKKGPKSGGVHPIVVVFENISQKALLWTQIRQRSFVKTNPVLVTQFDGNKLDKNQGGFNLLSLEALSLIYRHLIIYLLNTIYLFSQLVEVEAH